MVSDMILLQELPEVIRESVQAYTGCISGAIPKDEYVRVIEAAGFGEVAILEEVPFPVELTAGGVASMAAKGSLTVDHADQDELLTCVSSIRLRAVKPRGVG